MTDRKDRENERRGWLSKSYLVSPCSSAPFRWGRRSCLGLRTGVSPHFSMNSVREILALRGGYERGRIPLPSPMPPESGAPPHNTHPTMLPLHSSPLRSPTLLRSSSSFSFTFSSCSCFSSSSSSSFSFSAHHYHTDSLQNPTP